MARVKKAMHVARESISKINPLYDMDTEQIDEILESSEDAVAMICNGFRFGYMQGMKAAKAEAVK